MKIRLVLALFSILLQLGCAVHTRIDTKMVPEAIGTDFEDGKLTTIYVEQTLKSSGYIPRGAIVRTWVNPLIWVWGAIEPVSLYLSVQNDPGRYLAKQIIEKRYQRYLDLRDQYYGIRREIKDLKERYPSDQKGREAKEKRLTQLEAEMAAKKRESDQLMNY